MIIDGRAIAKEIYAETKDMVSVLSRAPKMTAVTCAPNFETQKYLNLKKQKAAEVGITLNIVELSESATTEEVITCVKRVSEEADGVVVQLPLPAHIDREAVLDAVPSEKDPDGFRYEVAEKSLPPVVGAINEIAKRADVVWQGKKVAVVGYGRLVGRPVAYFLKNKGAEVIVVTEETENVSEILLAVDVVVSGVGKPRFITADTVKDGVLIFDAGTSEDGGELVGDVDPVVAEKSYLFTPVPGGIGPITVACLLRNLVDLIHN